MAVLCSMQLATMINVGNGFLRRQKGEFDECEWQCQELSDGCQTLALMLDMVS